MATLTSSRTVPASVQATETRQRELWHALQSSIPSPFPTQAQREQEELLQDLEEEELHIDGTDPFDDQFHLGAAEDESVALVNNARSGESQVADEQLLSAAAQSVLGGLGSRAAPSEDLMPSIANVQMSCITTLNDLLSTPTRWRRIVPDRRHSMPPRSSLHPTATDAPSSALQTLVLNLRTCDPDAQQGSPSLETMDDKTMIHELQMHVDRLATHALSVHDAALVRTLASLIEHFHCLAILQPSLRLPSAPRVASWGSATLPVTPADPYANLRRQLSDFRLARGDRSPSPGNVASPVLQVEQALLWAKVDEELEDVLSLCRARTSDVDVLPPEYDNSWYDAEGEVEGLPQYEPGSSALADDLKGGYPSCSKTGESSSSSSPVERSPILGAHNRGLSEKMRMDLEAVTLAIDRLYLVAPQLHDQRVELKKSKVEQMERARLSGASRKGKEREIDEARELDKMLELIGRASERKMQDQVVVIEGGMQAKLERARQREREKRDEFVSQLVQHSESGRLHSQDAVLTPSGSARFKGKDPEAMLTLPEFIRETIPDSVQLKMQMADPCALLSLPEFVKEPVPQDFGNLSALPPPRRWRSGKDTRSRSMSAPPLAWLMPSSSRSSSPGATSSGESKKTRSSKARRVGSAIASNSSLQAGLEVTYVAEYHENLQHVLVFLTVSRMIAGVNLEAEVVPPTVMLSKGNGPNERLVLKCGLNTSPFLLLPARASPGKKEVKVDGQAFQIKLAATPSEQNLSSPAALLDASRLAEFRPTTFICASCSLPLVHCSRLREYRDLPSEHWAELVDAWMCHSDQKLHEDVMKHSNEGFWPGEGEALVGGSYILFEQSAIAQHNLWPCSEEDDGKRADDWQRVRCICGAVVGRSQEHRSQDGSRSNVYRMAKYAIRPVNPKADSCKIPLSAFIAEDMNEFVHAHATYRFIIFDEEEERPRILIWLFKPSMRIAYTTPAEYVITKSGSIHAAKVLFKVLGPSMAYSDLQVVLNKYPGFPQAEHLYYPLDICRRLAGLLKESNTAYPEGMRTMTGLDVGWLQRA
ncbi:uncharacterized protein LAESUDRAFT_732242 [Laetiporus sulphureus 93-53]|uniref:HECT domain-containing protein n=1 Tax=Laetiporus sulphureus 93-53 TaxID=1314785 RepID=A0A165B8T6_9APHY|nr:uncharacterized protein LAESUDRAFT_732242 [Laetiporus sulphureus 93-53]KZT00506.1 hypothetical protein LAESUDRAFT_732242 [Laetiporus sulphureus 93-53]